MWLYILLLVFVGISAGLAWFLIGRDKGPREPIIFLWIAAALGLVGALAAGWLEGRLLNPDNLLPGTAHSALIVTTMAVGAIEEACKFLPLAIVLYGRRFFNEHTDGVIYFALAGLGFGLPENILYTMQYGSEAGTARLFLTPLFHAAITGLVGYFLIKRKLAGKPAIGVIVPLSLAMVLHGIYNFGLLSGSAFYAGVSLAVTLALSAGLFMAWLRATEKDQDLGLSIVGHNAFCRSCGSANPRHHLYCTHCGKNA